MSLKFKAPPDPTTLSSSRATRSAQRERLIACAVAVIAADGLAALRARALADCVGCSVGAIYNLVTDLDELVLLVGQRTMAELNARLEAATPERRRRNDQYTRFIAWALAYCAFAAEHRNRWRALFEFRLAPGSDLPDWFAADESRLFERLESELAVHFPALDLAERRLRARTLFSAVHGIVALGLEEKIVAMPIAALESELQGFVQTYLEGLAERHAPPQPGALPSRA